MPVPIGIMLFFSEPAHSLVARLLVRNEFSSDWETASVDSLHSFHSIPITDASTVPLLKVRHAEECGV